MYGFPCSGIGLALCERLLSVDTEGLQLCLACRNMRRAEAARSALLTSHPKAQVALLQMDTSSISSVISAAQEVKKRWEDELRNTKIKSVLDKSSLITSYADSSLGAIKSHCLLSAGTTGWTTFT